MPRPSLDGKKSPPFQRRTPKQKRAQAKYNAVLDACTQVLSSQGYRRTTILELSLESGVAVPTLYQYFENKEAILLTWMDRTIEKMLQAVHQLKAGLPDDTPLQHIVRILLSGAFTAFREFQPATASLLQEMPQTLSRHMLTSLEENILQMLKTLFPEAVARLGSAEAAETKLRVLVKMVSGFLLLSLLNGENHHRLMEQAPVLERIILVYLQDLGLS
ncbi:MAG: TetR/AcrR family transcriptional regulator [Pseudomonadota bacterium]|nr:TetR/AcrR family transcriptional regulator [Pseudomonadota bacterium]